MVLNFSLDDFNWLSGLESLNVKVSGCECLDKGLESHSTSNGYDGL